MSESDDDYWESVGKANPFWGVLSQDRYRGSALDEENKKEFFAEGERNVGQALRIIRYYNSGGSFAPKAALDFGCGVGRLVLPMARVADHVTGVDVSPAMVAEAEETARRAGVENVRFTTEIPQDEFDWISSFIVFQHIEPRHGMVLLEKLLQRLTVGGIVSLHFSIFRDKRIWDIGLKDSEFGRYDGETFVTFGRGARHDMPIYEYDLSAVVCRFIAHGISQFFLEHVDHDGLHGVWIVGRRE